MGDITKTDPSNTTFSYSAQYCFKPEIDRIKFDTTLTLDRRLSLQKNLDVRQFAFFMYYSILAKKSDEPKIEGKVKLSLAFPPQYPNLVIGSPQHYPTIEERRKNYIPIPNNKAPKALREFIRSLLTEDFEKLPSMKKVHQKLKKIGPQTFNNR